MNAVDFHSDIAKAFGDRYQQSPDFQERFSVWSSLLETYIQPGASVLDAGCGTGVFSHYLTNRGCTVLGIDGSAEMIRLCQQQANPGATFRVSLLPINDELTHERFDAILSSSVLEYVPDLAKTLASFDRHLRPGGRLIVSLPNRHSVYRVLERVGFFLTGKPPYLQHVLHYGTAKSIAKLLETDHYQLIANQTFGGTNAIARLLRSCLPTSYADTLFVAVFQKK
ncbi:class I SAM-dependent methyltransferase [Fibrella aquatica]|uniref:class I SAM-dependent methyltransferase n=1 Tax=Fibrella aquatica TaxID=3242487 RepID=UPI00351FD9C6